jgi:hypothetical protein
LLKAKAETVGVLVMETFHPKQRDEGKWHAEMRTGIEKLKQRKVTKLVLDLTNNPGGRICLAQGLIRLLVPQANMNKANGQPGTPVTGTTAADRRRVFLSPFSYVTGIRKSPLFDRIAEAAYTSTANTPFVPKSFINPTTLKPYNDEMRWPSLEIDVWQRKGLPTTRHYGPLLDHCKFHPQETMIEHPFTGKNLVVMSNGACGSSCAIVAAFLQEVANTTSVYTAAEFHNTATNVPLYSFAGGQVLDSNTILRFMGHADFPEMPKPFPTNATLAFTFRSIYSQKSVNRLPLEFVGLKATWIVPVTTKNALQMDRLWESTCEAVGFFDVNQENNMCRELYHILHHLEKSNFLVSKVELADSVKQMMAPMNNMVKTALRLVRYDKLGFRTITEARHICENHGAFRLGPSLDTTSFENKEKRGEVIARGDAIEEFYDRRRR